MSHYKLIFYKEKKENYSDDKIIIVTTNGGGIFSLYHQALEKLLALYKSTNTYSPFKIVISDSNYINNKNFFDCFFEQEHDKQLVPFYLPETSRHVKFLKVVDSPDIEILRNILKQNKISSTIVDYVNFYKNKFQIDRNTLVVHIRLTDMNINHKNDYGYYSIEDYYKKINEMTDKNPNINSIFICSDNSESIKKIESMYGETYKIIYLKDEETYRVENEESDNYKYFYDNINQLDPTKILREILIASTGSYFIYRISDVSNFIILYSSSFIETVSLN